MKKRIILLLLVLFIVSGCKAEYEVEFVDKKISEKLTITENISLYNKVATKVENIDEYKDGISTNKELLEQYLKSNFNATVDSEKGKYNKKEIKNDEEFGIVYDYNFNVNNYDSSSLANSCNPNFKFYKIGTTKYAISTDKLFTCFSEQNLDSLRIHVKSNHVVSNNNADEVDGYNYYWNVNRNNYDNKRIYIEFYKNKYITNYENNLTKKILIISGIAFLGIIVIITVRKKVKQQNEW